MSDARVREPFPYVRACVVLAAGLTLGAALKVADVCRRIWTGGQHGSH